MVDDFKREETSDNFKKYNKIVSLLFFPDSTLRENTPGIRS